MKPLQNKIILFVHTETWCVVSPRVTCELKGNLNCLMEETGEVLSTTENAMVQSQLRVTWKIKSFTRNYLNGCSKCTEIESDPFEIVIGKIRTKWALLLRPNGDNRQDQHLGIFLQKKQESSQDYQYSGQFSILKNEKEIISWKFDERPAINDAIGCGYGSLEFLSHENLLQGFNDFVKDSQLIIRADIQLTAPKYLAEIFLNSSV